ncbi:hypothetical protein [Undibacterium terreum]|uniref:Uncharacterized protein n=1 Tax=Undibacterium terreum TaxID=1224302 RepID=A0A916UG08_9BURK|nr:hypothetical protein [Undibacterium terreum]GGC70939.1 hypothetical protein GCM10011396_17590 [Undibacterium terreum]
MNTKQKSDSPANLKYIEKIGVAKIKVKQASMQLTAVLGGFVEVDRLLLAWGSNTNNPIQCEFEVMFLDGNIFRGVYEFWAQKSKRPSLSNFIRACVRAPSPRFKVANYKSRPKPIIGKNGDVVEPEILERYEVERTG